MLDKNVVKNWFKSRLKPTQSQFWQWIDASFFKGEKLPMGDVEGLGDSLNGMQLQVNEVSNQLSLKADLAAVTDLLAQKINKVKKSFSSNAAAIAEGLQDGDLYRLKLLDPAGAYLIAIAVEEFLLLNVTVPTSPGGIQITASLYEGETVTIDWGDGNVENFVEIWDECFFNHTYPTAGDYTIIIKCNAPLNGINDFQVYGLKVNDIEGVDFIDNFKTSICFDGVSRDVAVQLLDNVVSPYRIVLPHSDIEDYEFSTIDFSGADIIDLSDNNMTIPQVNNLLLKIFTDKLPGRIDQMDIKLNPQSGINLPLWGKLNSKNNSAYEATDRYTLINKCLLTFRKIGTSTQDWKITLTGTGNLTVKWGDGTTDVYSGAGEHNPTHSYAQEGDYIAELTADSTLTCESIDVSNNNLLFFDGLMYLTGNPKTITGNVNASKNLLSCVGATTMDAFVNNPIEDHNSDYDFSDNMLTDESVQDFLDNLSNWPDGDVSYGFLSHIHLENQKTGTLSDNTINLINTYYNKPDQPGIITY